MTARSLRVRASSYFGEVLRSHAPPIQEARVAFFVVNLTGAMTTGGMIATLQNRLSSSDLTSLDTA